MFFSKNQLFDSEETYRVIFENAPVGIFQSSFEGRLLNANPALARMLGYDSPAEMISSITNIEEQCYVHPHHRRRAVETVLRRSGWFSFETEYARRDGSVIVVRLMLRAVPNEEGTPLFLEGFIEDITEDRRAEETPVWAAKVQAAFTDLSRVMFPTTSIEEISNLVLEYAKYLTDSPSGYVGYIDPRSGYLVCPTMTGSIWYEYRAACPEIVFKTFFGLWGWVLHNRKPLLSNKPAEDPRSSGVPPGHLPIHRFLSAPSLIGEELIGQVVVVNSAHDYRERDLDLVKGLSDLYAVVIHRKHAEEALSQAKEGLKRRVKQRNDELSTKAQNLAKIKATLDMVLNQRERDRVELEESILSNIRALVIPDLEKLKKSRLSNDQATYLAVLESHIHEITSPFIKKLSQTVLGLTPKEMQVANLIKEGKTTKEISDILCLSENAILFHRHNIRRKLGLKKKKMNLRTYLQSLKDQ